MGAIKLLSNSVSNKIAAGEVVERPLSVVKELVENAIDASASAISIDIVSGGIKEICVTDNGAGIQSDDVSLAFEKHATSKISTEKDLSYISTQGFRGEALASIAAVSVVDMKTKTREEELGSHIRISGGRADQITPAGLPDGTTVCVSNLFFNVPARLKFLKSAAQEAAYITDLVSRYVLSYPEISFHYRMQGKTVYHSSGNGSLKDAIYCVYGNAKMDNNVYADQIVGEINVKGYVSRPGTVMKNRRAGSVFVNRRYIRSSVVHDMVKSAYGQTLVKGEFPFFVLNITLPVSSVDVNVHPNKLQVRFKDTAAVEHVIKETVSLACTNIRGHVEIDTSKTETVVKNSVEMHTPCDFKQEDLFSGFVRSTLKEEAQNVKAFSQPYISKDTLPQVNTSSIINPKEEVIKDNYIEAPQQYRLIGSFGNTYALIEQGKNLLLVDQHAAHERILYDRFINNKTIVSQPLLSPYLVTVSHEQKNLINENLKLFESLGFEIAPFGILEFKVAAVPSVVFGASVSELINEAIYEIEENKSDAVLLREKIIRAACRSAVKAGDSLSKNEILSLVDRFLKTDTIPTCPHGRPIISVITKNQIEKSFKRVL